MTMMKIVTAAQMRELDRRTIEEAGVSGKILMERAGSGIVDCIERTLGSTRHKTVTVFCGKGNNGGDGFVVARLLHRLRAKVRIIAMAAPSELSRDAAIMYRRFVGSAGKSAIHRFASQDHAQAIIRDSRIVIDALLGTGMSHDVTGPYAEAIESINTSNCPVIAVDIPSGLHAETGAVMGHAVKASHTVTLGLPKRGLFQGSGIDFAGSVSVVDLGIPSAFIDSVPTNITLMTPDFIRSLLPVRQASQHKGTFGHAGLIAGSVGKTGAAAMAAMAALRIGTGLVTVAVPSGLNDIVESKLLEAMTVPMPDTKAKTFARSGLDRLSAFAAARTAVAIGPGLSTHPETVELVQGLIGRLDCPAVLDADALNALAGRASILTACKIPPILTPHPGEMARLESNATSSSVNLDRIGTAVRFARERGVFVVLKGARTVVAGPDGAAAICPTGNPGMATAGTGDVLTGMIVGLLAQGLKSWDASCAATYLHGLAGDLAAFDKGQAGLVARDLIEQIPYALKAAYGT